MGMRALGTVATRHIYLILISAVPGSVVIYIENNIDIISKIFLLEIPLAMESALSNCYLNKV